VGVDTSPFSPTGPISSHSGPRRPSAHPTIYDSTQLRPERTAPVPTPPALGGAEYEPEQFPGLIYRLKEPKAAILLFRSGKAVCTGARQPSEIEEAVEKITAELKTAGLLH
jgi:hypothetical protein